VRSWCSFGEADCSACFPGAMQVALSQSHDLGLRYARQTLGVNLVHGMMVNYVHASLDCNTVWNRRAEWTDDAVTDAMCQVCICWYHMAIRDITACGPQGSLKDTLSRADAFANKICRNSS
jgi:hypothetical protein